MRSRLFHAIVVVGTSITATGPIAVAVSGCDFFQGRTDNPDLFWVHVDIAPWRPEDLSAVDHAWVHVDIPMLPPVDMTIDPANDAGVADLPLSDGDIDGSDGEG
jgi:hypothetical protein